MAKAAHWTETDVEARKRGEQTGLDTLVVHAVNDVDQESDAFEVLGSRTNEISRPPGEYGRKVKTQMN